jgi:hypothetical protein
LTPPIRMAPEDREIWRSPAARTARQSRLPGQGAGGPLASRRAAKQTRRLPSKTPGRPFLVQAAIGACVVDRCAAGQAPARASGLPSQRMSIGNFDRWFDESDYTKGEEPQALAEWLAAQTGTRIEGRSLEGSETFHGAPPAAGPPKRRKR